MGAVATLANAISPDVGISAVTVCGPAPCSGDQLQQLAKPPAFSVCALLQQITGVDLCHDLTAALLAAALVVGLVVAWDAGLFRGKR